jgi:hypothetical protein
MNARLALFACFGLFGCASNVAPDGSPNAEPSAALSSQPPATSASPSSSQASTTPSSASSAQTSGSANAEADCKQQPWPTFKAPALAAAEAPAPGATRVKKPHSSKPAPEAGAIPGATEVVQSMSPEFGRCFTRQLCEDPKTELKLRLTLTVDPLGQVSEASSTGANPEQALFARCIESAAKSKRFSPPQGGIATLVLPLNFKPGA